MSVTVTPVPNVSELHPAAHAEGLLVSGYAATFNLDKANDAINRFALDATVAKFMATNPVLLYAHKLGLPPVGKILRARIDRTKGLFVEALLPRPSSETSLAFEVWESVKNGLLRALSVGGAFFRNSKGTHNEVHGMRLDEISICPVAVNGEAFATGVTPTHVKCLADGGFVPVEDYREYKSLMDQAGSLSRLAAGIAEHEQRKRELDELHTAVSRIRLGIASR